MSHLQRRKECQSPPLAPNTACGCKMSDVQALTGSRPELWRPGSDDTVKVASSSTRTWLSFFGFTSRYDYPLRFSDPEHAQLDITSPDSRRASHQAAQTIASHHQQHMKEAVQTVMLKCTKMMFSDGLALPCATWNVLLYGRTQSDSTYSASVAAHCNEYKGSRITCYAFDNDFSTVSGI